MSEVVKPIKTLQEYEADMDCSVKRSLARCAYFNLLIEENVPSVKIHSEAATTTLELYRDCVGSFNCVRVLLSDNSAEQDMQMGKNFERWGLVDNVKD